ncbi:beta-ketoacyl synthase N-terminal-like domain-containing protein [Sorangium sp. So ce281]|uniref:type I polyketide synthase n=1 Tax=unclassified Sorangium TaxID=2621164 RepID=UPI003F5F307D
MSKDSQPPHGQGTAIAVIGLACRFPSSPDIDAFWRLLSEGREGITYFTDEELLAAGVDAAVLNQPNYVKAAPLLDGAELFDAGFFSYTPREARMIEPQQRQLLECAWAALENAGYDSESYAGRVGVFAGAAMNTYILNLLVGRPTPPPADWFQTIIGNEKDYLATRVSYNLNLRGPSVTVQTACSSSLAAVHYASQSLLSGECDMALVGGVSVRVPQKTGYFYQEGMVASPDGHCRTFDADAQGTLFGSGVGAVVLKRLEDAERDGDAILALLRGSAVNNDGSAKVGYTAPSVSGQSEVIAEAITVADVHPETISYVEAHGTGTALGDPIEIEALTDVFRARTQKKGFCAVGALKASIGHLDAAAGIAGLIKTVLMLSRKTLLPSVNFKKPNPRIDFANSPFFVNTTLRSWPEGPSPRRAGLSSFGIGGTNVHVVLEEAPPREQRRAEARPWYVLPLSAKTETALDAATANLAAHLEANATVDLADVAHTLQVGRRRMSHRRVVVCRDLADAAAALRTRDPKRVFSYRSELRERPIVFMFPGGGAQHVAMGRDLYNGDAGFRGDIDRCAAIIRSIADFDIREVMYPRDAASMRTRIEEIHTALLVLFAVEYALAQLWMRLGVQPTAMIGHSIGEYVAACVAGVFSLEDALRLVDARGRLMATVPSGAMLSAQLPEKEAARFLGSKLSLAAINGSTSSVFSGPVQAIDALQERLVAEKIEHRRVHIAIGAHSSLVDPILPEFTRVVQRLTRRAPEIRYISNVTGTWIRPEEATDPAYWARHLRETVRFAEGLAQLATIDDALLLEVGPGQTLGGLARGQVQKQMVLSSMRHPDTDVSDVALLSEVAGKLWILGGKIDWRKLDPTDGRRRVPLPTYPFERQRHWVDPVSGAFGQAGKVESSQAEAGEGDAAANQQASSGLHPRPQLLNAYTAPRSDLERTITGVWQQVFGIAEIGVHDNFFELGGTSLLASTLTAAINNVIDIELVTRDLLRAPTVEEISAVVASKQAALEAEILAEIEQLSDKEVKRLLEGDDGN